MSARTSTLFLHLQVEECLLFLSIIVKASSTHVSSCSCMHIHACAIVCMHAFVLGSVDACTPSVCVCIFYKHVHVCVCVCVSVRACA